MHLSPPRSALFLYTDTPTTDIYTLSLHDALPICNKAAVNRLDDESGSKVVAKTTTGTRRVAEVPVNPGRSEEHTSELQSRGHLVCRLLLEKKNLQRQNGNASIRTERRSQKGWTPE